MTASLQEMCVMRGQLQAVLLLVLDRGQPHVNLMHRAVHLEVLEKSEYLSVSSVSPL